MLQRNLLYMKDEQTTNIPEYQFAFSFLQKPKNDTGHVKYKLMIYMTYLLTYIQYV